LTSPSSWPQLSLLRKAKASRKPHTFKLSRERERDRTRLSCRPEKLWETGQKIHFNTLIPSQMRAWGSSLQP
jgi:hypothetical protein